MLKRIFKSSTLVFFFGLMIVAVPTVQAQTSESGSIGVEGTIPAPPPSTPATISAPGNGSSFSNSPINVSGVCPPGLLIKLFKNGVFSGSAPCVNGSYSIQTDLFAGTNEFVAIVYDDLDQEGPESNRIIVNYDDSTSSSPLQRVQVTSNFARKGANPGQTLTWPIIISGGLGPYAVSIDWGDGSQDSLLSVRTPGEFTAEHVYDSAGTYTVIVKVTDSEGRIGYLQLVGVANGPLEAIAETDGGAAATITVTRILWQPMLILIPFIISTFWLGKRYELKRIRTKIEKGELPFNLS